MLTATLPFRLEHDALHAFSGLQNTGASTASLDSRLLDPDSIVLSTVGMLNSDAGLDLQQQGYSSLPSLTLLLQPCKKRSLCMVAAFNPPTTSK